MKKIVAFVLMLCFLGGLLMSIIPSFAHADGAGTLPVPEAGPEPPPPPDD
jgi:hypothetical protein